MKLNETTLVPMVRAALERGEGPPAVVAWVRESGATQRPFDESRIRALAGRLAETLAVPRDLRTVAANETLHHRFVV